MKIVHLIDYFQPKVGYQEFFLAREHQKLGHEVVVVTSDRYFPFPNYQQSYKKILAERVIGEGKTIEEGITTIRLKTIEIPGSNLVILRALPTTLSLLRPDLVFCHGVHSLTSFWVAKYKYKFGYRLIYDSHASYFNTNFKSSLVKRIYHYLYKKIAVPELVKQANSIFAIGEEEKRFLSQDFDLDRSKIPVILLGVDSERFTFSKEERNRVRKKFNFKDSDVVIVYAGKIFETKDVHVLFKAVEKLNYQNIKLLIVGGGNKSYLNRLKSLIRDKNLIRWLPLVANRDLPAFYSGADIGVWPGDPSITMLEAMACSLPIIIPRGKQTKYLDKSMAVVRFKRGDVDDLVLKLKQLILSRQKRIKLGKKAQKYIKDNLSWEKIARETVDLVS